MRPIYPVNEITMEGWIKVSQLSVNINLFFFSKFHKITVIPEILRDSWKIESRQDEIDKNRKLYFETHRGENS